MTLTDDNFGLPTGEIIASEDANQCLEAMTKSLLGHALLRVEENGEFHVALSSNTVLEDVYCLLMYDPDLRAMPWSQIHIWFLHDQQGHTIDETIIMHSGIPEEQVHRNCLHTSIEQDSSFHLDCCLLELEDIPTCTDAMCDVCDVMLILAEDRNKLASLSDWSFNGSAYWFTEMIDLSPENP